MADQSDPVDVRALLDREQLSSSHLAAWRRQRKRGTLPPPPPVGALPAPVVPPNQDQEIARLRAEVTRLQHEVDRLRPLEGLHRQLSQVLARPGG